jgi:hypothetical protein
MVFTALHNLRLQYLTRRYKSGKTLMQFIATDVRRDVEVIDASRVARGMLTVRTRTWNVLYAAKGIDPKPPFGEVREVAIAELWKWSGETWGGPVPPSTDKTA